MRTLFTLVRSKFLMKMRLRRLEYAEARELGWPVAIGVTTMLLLDLGFWRTPCLCVSLAVVSGHRAGGAV